MAKRADVYTKILNINLELSKEELVEELELIKKLIESNKDESHESYKKHYYKKHKSSVIIRKINNAKMDFKKAFPKRNESDKNKKVAFILKDRLNIGRRMLEVQEKLYVEEDKKIIIKLNNRMIQLSKDWSSNILSRKKIK